MTARTLLRKWNEFFFSPQSPTPIALYRILYGLLNVINILTMRHDWLTWFGPRAVVSVETVHRAGLPGFGFTMWPDIGVLQLLPQTNDAIMAFYWVSLVAAICLTLGCMSRLTSVAVYVCLASLHARNPYIINGGDQLLRVCGFFVMFAPVGAAMSVDRLWRIWRGREGLAIAPRRPWAQRMIQIQTAIMYVATFWWKTLGTTWLDGTAVYYALARTDFKRFPVPGLNNPLFVRLATWLTLVVEFAAGTLIWLRDLRYPVLLAVIGLHLGIDYAMVLSMFEWVAIADLVTFIYPEDLTRAWSWVRERAGPWLGAPITLVYDGASVRGARAATVIQAINVFGRLHFVDLCTAGAPPLSPKITASAAQGRLMVLSGATACTGVAGLRAIAPRIPLLWPVALLSLLMPHMSPAVPSSSTVQ